MRRLDTVGSFGAEGERLEDAGITSSSLGILCFAEMQSQPRGARPAKDRRLHATAKSTLVA